MTNKELYQATFSQVHGEVRQADFPRRKRRSPRTFAALAAAIMLAAALSATAVAMLLTALFSGDIKKAAHNVKDLMAALLAQGFPIEGFVFDSAGEPAQAARPKTSRTARSSAVSFFMFMISFRKWNTSRTRFPCLATARRPRRRC